MLDVGQLVRKRQLPIIGGGTGVWSWIHVKDAAAATVAAIDHGKRGIYNIVDDEPAPVRGGSSTTTSGACSRTCW